MERSEWRVLKRVGHSRRVVGATVWEAVVVPSSHSKREVVAKRETVKNKPLG